MSYIPVLDFSAYATEHGRRALADEICRTLKTVGFLYLRNHGIPQSQADLVFAESATFFQQPEEKKLKFCRPDKSVQVCTAYVRIGQEQLNPLSKKEIREAFDFAPTKPIEEPLPEQFEASMTTLESSFRDLAIKLLHCIGLGLELKNEHFFVECHKSLSERSDSYGTMFRTLYYPPYQPDSDSSADDGVVRLGSHSDYGTLTMLIQDDIGGLEVEHVNGEFVPADPVSNTVLINIGDLLQRWTNDQLKATKHRVLMNHAGKTCRARQSIAMFIHPDNNTIVEGLEGYSKYPSILARDHLAERYRQTY